MDMDNFFDIFDIFAIFNDFDFSTLIRPELIPLLFGLTLIRHILQSHDPDGNYKHIIDLIVFGFSVLLSTIYLLGKVGFKADILAEGVIQGFIVCGIAIMGQGVLRKILIHDSNNCKENTKIKRKKTPKREGRNNFERRKQ